MLLRRWAWLILSDPVTSSRIRPITVISLWRHNSGPWDNGESIAAHSNATPRTMGSITIQGNKGIWIPYKENKGIRIPYKENQVIRICRPRGLYQGQFRAKYWIKTMFLQRCPMRVCVCPCVGVGLFVTVPSCALQAKFFPTVPVYMSMCQMVRFGGTWALTGSGLCP